MFAGAVLEAPFVRVTPDAHLGHYVIRNAGFYTEGSLI